VPFLHRSLIICIWLTYHRSACMQRLKCEHTNRTAHIDRAKPSALKQANFAKRSFAEKQLALNLAQFADANNDLDLGKDQVENLVGALIVSRTTRNTLP